MHSRYLLPTIEFENWGKWRSSIRFFSMRLCGGSISVARPLICSKKTFLCMAIRPDCTIYRWLMGGFDCFGLILKGCRGNSASSWKSWKCIALTFTFAVANRRRHEIGWPSIYKGGNKERRQGRLSLFLYPPPQACHFERSEKSHFSE